MQNLPLHNMDGYLVEIDIHLNEEEEETQHFFSNVAVKYLGTNNDESRSLKAMVFPFSLNP